MPRQDRACDAVGVALAHALAPAAVAGLDLARRVALDVARQLLQLHPEQARAVRRARGVHRQRLAEHDRRLGGQQAALGLVDGARDAVEPGRDVHDRGAAEALVALPGDRLRERQVDLHLGAAVAEALCRRPRLAGHAGHALEQPAVELRGRDVRDHRARRARRSRRPPAARRRRARPRRPRFRRRSRCARCRRGRRGSRSARPPASLRRRAGSACRPPAPRRRSPAPCSPRPPPPGRGRCAAPRARAGRARPRSRTSPRASRAR